tara:strand:+ start:3157 stop:4704 length:1548 start_codon:yes stop_codon:yes gene_type:complete
VKTLTLDLEEYSESESKIFDLCIIGSGPAGLSLASKFIGTNINVAILESGITGLSKRHDQLNEAQSIGEREIDSMNSRSRRYGGAMQLWAGTSAPFSEIELLDRKEIGISGWPVTWEELVPFYKEAAELLDVSWNLFFRPYQEFKTQMSDAFPNLIGKTLRFNNYFQAKNIDLTMSLDKKFSKASNISIFTNATVVDFEFEQGKLTQAITKTINGRKVKLSAKYFVLCNGALEATRLLLTSKLFVNNLPNHLGKNFMSHPSFTDLAYVHFKRNERKWVNKTKLHTKVDFELNFAEQNLKKVLRHNIHMSPSYEKNQNLVLESSRINKEFNKFDANKPQFNSLLLRLWDIFCRVLGKRAWTNTWNVSIGIEQEPIETRSLSLSDERDELGINKLKLDGGEISQLEKRTISAALSGLDKALRENNVGELVLSDNYLSGSYLSRQDAINHHIGTIKMGSSCTDGVVDNNLKVFEYDNLYVCSSAVFPTSSNANPTFTIVALSLRLGNMLKKALQNIIN